MHKYLDDTAYVRDCLVLAITGMSPHPIETFTLIKVKDEDGAKDIAVLFQLFCKPSYIPALGELFDFPNYTWRYPQYDRETDFRKYISIIYKKRLDGNYRKKVLQ